MLCYWAMVGDDFHVANWMFATLPISLAVVIAKYPAELHALANELHEERLRNTSFKLNAGKRVGSYNLALCRRVTDRSDALFVEALGLKHVQDDIDLMYSQIVKTNFDEAPEEEDD